MDYNSTIGSSHITIAGRLWPYPTGTCYIEINAVIFNHFFFVLPIEAENYEVLTE